MAQFKFTAEAKQIFLDVYNDPSVSSLELAKEITKRLRKEGFLGEKEKITSKLCRVALEDKLGKKYVNRPRVKHETLIEFEEENTTATTTTTAVEEDNVLVSEEETEDETVDTLEEEEVVETETNQWRQEPSKFEF